MLVNDICRIIPTDNADECVKECWEKDADGNYVPKLTSTLDTTLNDLNNDLLSPISAHRLRFGNGKPLRVTYTDYIRLYTDGTYQPDTYVITYLRYPTPIDIHDKYTAEYTDLPAYTHSEIIQVAADLYLAAKGLSTIETQSQIEAAME